MKTRRFLFFAAALLAAACARTPSERMTLDIPALASADTLTAWTLDGAVRVAECYEMAPDRPLGYVWIAGFDGENLLIGVRDSIHFVGPDGRFRSSFCRRGNGPQEYLHDNLFLDPEGRVLVLDAMKNRALTYLPDGTFVSAKDSVYAFDIHMCADGSRAVMNLPGRLVGEKPVFSLHAPDGTMRYASPEREASEKMLMLSPGHFNAAPDGTCYFKYEYLDTLYHIRPDRVEAVLAFSVPAKPDDKMEDQDDGSVAFEMIAGRFVERSCKVLGDLLFYSFRDTDRNRTHHLVYDLSAGKLLYHALQAPLLRVGDAQVRTWPSFVSGNDAWCQLSREDAEALLPDYNDDSNDAYLHIVSR